jgi:hypothetical protein
MKFRIIQRAKGSIEIQEWRQWRGRTAAWHSIYETKKAHRAKERLLAMIDERVGSDLCETLAELDVIIDGSLTNSGGEV